MKKSVILMSIIAFIMLALLCFADDLTNQTKSATTGNGINLPKPSLKGTISVEEALASRRSIRTLDPTKPLTLEQLGQILWAAQGITDEKGHRTAPSAMACYAIELYVIANKIDNLAVGAYKYVPEKHQLETCTHDDIFAELTNTAIKQAWVKDAACIIVINTLAGNITSKIGDKGIEFAHMEAGFVGQNIYLQTTAMNLGTTFACGFDAEGVAKALVLSDTEKPVAIMPIGYKK